MKHTMKIKAYYSYSDKIKIHLGDAVEIMERKAEVVLAPINQAIILLNL